MQTPDRIRDMRTALLALALVAASLAFAGSPDRLQYIYKRGNDESVMRINGSLDEYVRLAKRWTGPYIWVSHEGRQWLIRDAAVLAAAQASFAPMEALEPSMRAVEERLRPIEKRHDAIERRVDDLGDRVEDEPSLEDELRKYERQLRAVEEEMQVVEAEMERIEDELDRREEVAEKKFESIVLKAIREGKGQRVDRGGAR